MLIALTKGYESVIDDASAEIVARYKWSASVCKSAKVYAASWWRGKKIIMHRLIMDAPIDQTVDHINGDTLDNRLVNLRICSQSDNAKNRLPNAGRKFKGVSFHQRIGLWQSRIGIGGERVHLGYFETELAAALAYDKEAARLYGAFARPNFGRADP